PRADEAFRDHPLRLVEDAAKDLFRRPQVVDAPGPLPGGHEASLWVAVAAQARVVQDSLLRRIGDLLGEGLDLRGVTLKLRHIGIADRPRRLAGVAARADGRVVPRLENRLLVRGSCRGLLRGDESSADHDAL